jgi:hypothetical protein
MAIYRLSADIVKRSEGRTVTAAAAYRAAELITDQRTGLVFDYRRRHGVIETTILAPAGAPAWWPTSPFMRPAAAAITGTIMRTSS